MRSSVSACLQRNRNISLCMDLSKNSISKRLKWILSNWHWHEHRTRQIAIVYIGKILAQEIIPSSVDMLLMSLSVFTMRMRIRIRVKASLRTKMTITTTRTFFYVLPLNLYFYIPLFSILSISAFNSFFSFS